MRQLQMHIFIGVWSMFTLLGLSVFSFTEEKQFADTLANNSLYSTEFPPKERMEFWASSSHAVTSQEFEKVLEKMKAIDELSDESGLSLMEFKSFAAMKFACMHTYEDKSILVEYLDRLADYTRKSARWQKEIYATEYSLSLYYAALGEFEKAYEALSRFYDKLLEEGVDEWLSYNSLWDALSLCHHAACILAATGRYDKAIEVCNRHIKSVLMTSEDTERVDATFAKLHENGISREHYLTFVSELQKKRAYFKEKDVWSYFCQLSLVAAYKLDADGNETDEFYGFNFCFQWFQKHGEWRKPPAADPGVPALTRWFVPLAPVVVDINELRETRNHH